MYTFTPELFYSTQKHVKTNHDKINPKMYEMKKLILVFTFVITVAGSNAQYHLQLLSNPANVNYDNIVNQTEAYYSTHYNGPGSGYKQFHRWKEDQKYKLDASRNLINYDLLVYNNLNNAKPGGTIQPQSVQWQNFGPGESGGSLTNIDGVGCVTRIAIDPNDGNIIYVGTPAGGLWRSLDGGTNWTALLNGTANIGVSGIAIDPSSPVGNRTIYILTGDGSTDATKCIGIQVSTDNGNSFANISGFPAITAATTGLQGDKILVHPTNSNILFVAMYGGLYCSTNKGATWSKPITGIRVTDVEFVPGTPSTIWAGTADGRVYLSTNTGSTFAAINNGLPSNAGYLGKVHIGVTPIDPQVLYVYFPTSPASGQFGGVYKSINGGTSFNLMSNSPNIVGNSLTGNDNLSYSLWSGFAVSPINKNTIFSATFNAWSSTDGGTTWQRKSNNSGNHADPAYMHTDFHDIVFNGATIYCANDGGIYRSTDNGTTWVDISLGLQVTEIYSLGIHPTISDRLLFGTQDNGTFYWQNNQYRSLPYKGDGANCFFDQTATPARIYHSVVQGPTYCSTDNGLTTTQMNPSISGNNAWIFPFLNDPNAAANIYYGHIDLYRSINQGGNWTNFTNGSISATQGTEIFQIAPSNSTVYYAKNGGNFYRSINSGVTWGQIVLVGNAALPGLNSFLNFTISSNNSNFIWITGTNAQGNNLVFFSPDGGTTWQDRTLIGLPAAPLYITALVHDRNSTRDRIFVGTSAGVFYLDNDACTWVSYNLNNAMPTCAIKALKIDYTANKLIAATYGRGLYWADLPPANAVTLCCTSGSIFDNTSFNGTYSNTTLNFYGTNRLNGSTTFNNCNIFMGKDAKIIVSAGTSLTITSTNTSQFTRIHSCGDMWDGIYIEPTIGVNQAGNLIINNSTLIEDAKNAVVAIGGSSKYTINGAIFNKNYYAILHPLTLETATSSRSIINSLFTCRVFGANPNILTYIQSATASTPALLTALPKATLVAPHAGETAYTGIDVNSITGNLNIGNRTLPVNIFDNLYYGVQAHSSNVYVKHNTFQNMTAVPANCVTIPATCPTDPSCSGSFPLFCCFPMTFCSNFYPNGAAVFAETAAGTNTLTLQVGGPLSNEKNTFTNCYESIHEIEYANVTVRYNNISNNAATTGNYGLYMLNSRSTNINVTNNTINNCTAGIYNLRQGVNISGTININSNSITATGGAIVNNGIRLQDITNAQQSKNIFVNTNTISGVEIGISLENVKASAQVNGNNITLNSLNSAGATRWGILLTGADMGPGGNYNDVNGNTINGGITAPVSANIGIKGIYAYLSPNSSVKCNTVNNLGQSLVFEGTCNPSTVTNNTMNTAYDGFVLKNSGIIGAQGSLVSASDNQWVATSPAVVPNNFYYSQLLADNSNMLLGSSPLYVQNISPGYKPTKNQFLNSGVLPVFTNAAASVGCGGGGGAFAASSSAPVASGSTTDVAISTISVDQQISPNTNQYPVYAVQSRLFDQLAAYEYLQNNPSLIKGKYKKFCDSLSLTAIGACQKFNRAIQQSDMAMAQSLNNSFTPVTPIEQNHQTINKYLLDGLANGKYELARKEKNSVKSIASQCALTGGKAVFQARALYNMLAGHDTIFIEICKDNFTNAKLAQNSDRDNTPATLSLNSIAKLYPNPNGGSFILEYNIVDATDALFEIFDITGKRIDSVKLNGKVTLAEVNENGLENGIYYYRISVNGNAIAADKLVVIK